MHGRLKLTMQGVGQHEPLLRLDLHGHSLSETRTPLRQPDATSGDNATTHRMRYSSCITRRRVQSLQQTLGTPPALDEAEYFTGRRVRVKGSRKDVA